LSNRDRSPFWGIGEVKAKALLSCGNVIKADTALIWVYGFEKDSEDLRCSVFHPIPQGYIL